MTEGEKAINIKLSLSLPQSFFKRKMTAPSSEGAFVGQPQGLSLRFVVVSTVSFATAFCCFSLTMQLLLFRKNHARLACSVVNALTTARCRYQLLRILDSRKGCPYGRIYISLRAKHPLLYTFHPAFSFGIFALMFSTYSSNGKPST